MQISSQSSCEQKELTLTTAEKKATSSLRKEARFAKPQPAGERTLSDTGVITIVHLEENTKLEVCQKTC